MLRLSSEQFYELACYRLVGASVKMVGGKAGTITDVDGRFAMQVKPGAISMASSTCSTMEPDVCTQFLEAAIRK